MSEVSQCDGNSPQQPQAQAEGQLVQLVVWEASSWVLHLKAWVYPDNNGFQII